jgi:hypothetical protein
MVIRIKNPNQSALNFMRRCGYSLQPHAGDKQSFVKILAHSGYPRFHAYVKEEDSGLIINLHLDQKRPSYKGTKAHGGEYKGKLLEAEAQRIKTQ